MYRWCAYCQHYLGEKAPFEDYSLTHGICAECVYRGTLRDHDAITRMQPIVDFYTDVANMARSGETVPVATVVRRGLALGMRPVDLLVGILQPTLYEVGHLWESGLMTSSQEASFSSFCDAVMTELTREQELLCPAVSAPLVLLLNAEGNRHTLGLRMATFLLREGGLNAQTLVPTPSSAELAAVLADRRPAVVGVSLATNRQLPFLDAILTMVARHRPPPRVVAGGPAVRAGCALPPGVEGWTQLEELLRPPR